MSTTVAFTLNGRPVEVDAETDDALLYVLRNQLGLRGTRYGCGAEQCGACMVLIDGGPIPSCTCTLDSVAGRSVVTVEGLAQDGVLHPLQQAMLDLQAGQCGYCLSGILISAHALLAANPSPSRTDIARALDRHLCRCGIGNRIIRGVERAALAMA